MNAILPALTILPAVLSTAVPFGLPADATFILPLVVVMMVFVWRAFPQAVLPPVVAMLLGLLTDVATGGPLGFWGLMALIAASVGARVGPIAARHGAGVLWLVWIPLVMLLAGSGWLLASLYFFRWVGWWPFLFGALASIALFPSVLYLLLKINRAILVSRSKLAYGGHA
jgi:rod shape-determining protein MreD